MVGCHWGAKGCEEEGQFQAIMTAYPGSDAILYGDNG